MHCVQCGAVLTESARFCEECGRAVAVRSAAVAATAVSSIPVRDLEPPVPVMVPPTQSATKPCAYCGEQILQIATRCRFCNSDLTPAFPPAISVQAPASPAASPSIVIQNVQSQQGLVAGREFKNPGVALLLSIIFPGGGQFYNGHGGKGIVVLLTFWLVLPYIWSWFDAYSCAKRINRVGF